MPSLDDLKFDGIKSSKIQKINELFSLCHISVSNSS